MAADLLYPYAYDEDARTYLAPHDKRVVKGRAYDVGGIKVYLRIITGKRPHFWDPSGTGGGGPETPAHIFAKAFYQERGFFSAVVGGQRLLVRFESCVVEQRLDYRVPDLTAVIDECWPPFFPSGSRFIIEIHSKNAIHQNEGRSAALEQIGVPCVEVHLSSTSANWKFDAKADPERERRRFENYMTKALTDPGNVRWIVPRLAPKFAGSEPSVSFLPPVGESLSTP